MDIGFLALCFFGAIPFLHEFETLGTEEEEWPSFIAVIQLRRFRRQRWAWGFGILFLLLVLVAIAPSASGKPHPAALPLVLKVLAVQGALWAFVFQRVRRARSKRGTNERNAT